MPLCFMLPINISRAYSICLDSLSKFKCKSNRANWALWAAWCTEDLRAVLWQAIHIYFAHFCTALHNLHRDVRAEALKMPPDAAKYAQSQMTLSTLLYVCPRLSAVSLRRPGRLQLQVDRGREREAKRVKVDNAFNAWSDHVKAETFDKDGKSGTITEWDQGNIYIEREKEKDREEKEKDRD